jgi:hypothetical protein
MKSVDVLIHNHISEYCEIACSCVTVYIFQTIELTLILIYSQIVVHRIDESASIFLIFFWHSVLLFIAEEDYNAFVYLKVVWYQPSLRGLMRSQIASPELCCQAGRCNDCLSTTLEYSESYFLSSKGGQNF